MIAFWLPFALLAGFVALAQRSSQAHAVAGANQNRGLNHGMGNISPIAVMNECLRMGRRPPDVVIQCAIAEARLIGRHDLAAQLLDTFAAPMLAAPATRAYVQSPQYAAPQMTQAAQAAQATQAPVPAPAVAYAPQPAAPLPPGVLAFRMPDEGGARAQGAPIMQAAPVATLPIPGIDHAKWEAFRGALAREAPTFATKRHVGRYRQNRERLAELGVDPDVVAQSVDAQDAALAADVADAYRHVTDSGMYESYVGQPVAIPRAPDADASDAVDVPVTLSGVLGVANVAGLEGAAEWFENQHDRTRFPHTTAAFLRTNGVF